MLGGVTHHMLPHLPEVPHLHVNRPSVGTPSGVSKFVFSDSFESKNSAQMQASTARG